MNPELRSLNTACLLCEPNEKARERTANMKIVAYTLFMCSLTTAAPSGHLLKAATLGLTGSQGTIIGQDYHTTITRHIGIPIPQPYAVPIERHIPVPIKVITSPKASKVPVGVRVDRPFAVPVAQHIPIPVDRPYPVAVDRPFAVAVPQPVAVPVVRQVGIPIPHPVPVGIKTPVAVPVPQPVPVSADYGGLNYDSYGLSNNIGSTLGIH